MADKNQECQERLPVIRTSSSVANVSPDEHLDFTNALDDLRSVVMDALSIPDDDFPFDREISCTINYKITAVPEITVSVSRKPE